MENDSLSHLILTIFDIQMKKNANCLTCAVTWGSHSKEKLQSENSTYLIDDVQALLKI